MCLGNRWDEKYRAGYGAGGEVEPLVARAVAGLPAGLALDLACGLGRNAIYLASLGWRVIALDYSTVALAKLAGLSIDARVTDLQNAGFRLPEAEYDLIVDVLYLQRSLFAQIRAALKPGGIFTGVVAMGDDDPEVAPMNPDYLCAPGELRAVFADWIIRHYREAKPEGRPERRKVAEIIAERPFSRNK